MTPHASALRTFPFPLFSPGTRKKDLVVSIQPDRLTVRLNWYGRVLEGPLKKRIKAGEACWSIDSTDVDLRALKAAASLRQQQLKPHVVQQQAEGSVAASPDITGMVGGIAGGSSSSSSSSGSGGSVVEMCELLFILPKEEGGRYWRALFEGGEEKSHMQVRRLAGGCTGWAVRLNTMSYGFDGCMSLL